ncbi:MAG: flippase-like domain-containing protein [Actinomycetota bacterium]|nr:flippase-like domain-containing protein [Actinomycetota bacterium]
MTRRLGQWARGAGGAAILALVVWRLGTGPIVAGFRTVNGRALAAAAGLTVVTTACSAWRWSIVARGLGVAVSARSAVGAYYRSQFLNTALPGGVLGDVHRGLRHGRQVGDVGRALRAVVLERCAGQAVQVLLALGVLLVFPSPFRASLPVLLTLVAAGTVGLAMLVRLGPGRPGRWARIVASELYEGLLGRRVWPRLTLASIVVVAGHVATFVVAARTAGSTASTATLLPLAMLVLLAMSVPVNVAGWGPREGVAAWTFGAAGLGSAHGVAAATVYGVLVFLACLPGLVVLVVARQRRPADGVVPPAPDEASAPAARPKPSVVRAGIVTRLPRSCPPATVGVVRGDRHG